MPAEKPDPWRLLEQYRARWTGACDQLDDAMNRLDPTAEREARATLEGLFANVHTVLEEMQSAYPEDKRISDALERFTQVEEQSRRSPRVLLASEAKRLLKRLQNLTNPAMSPPVAAPNPSVTTEIPTVPTQGPDVSPALGSEMVVVVPMIPSSTPRAEQSSVPQLSAPAAKAAARPANTRARGPDLKTSRERIDLLNELRGELTKIVMRWDEESFIDPEELRRRYPHFKLWNHVSPQEFWKSRESQDRFNVKHYADLLVCQKYCLLSPETLKKDRQKLRAAGKRTDFHG